MCVNLFFFKWFFGFFRIVVSSCAVSDLGYGGRGVVLFLGFFYILGFRIFRVVDRVFLWRIFVSFVG